MPIPTKCFEPDFGNFVPLPQLSIPENWIDLFVNALLANGITETNPTLKEEFRRHIGDNSVFTFKTELQLQLQQLYLRFMTEGEAELDSNKKVDIATKIQEGIAVCPAGFYNRIIALNQSFSIPFTLKALLTRVRHHIVNSVAIKAIANVNDAGQHVHVHNRFYLIASQLFGVQKIQETDPFTGPLSDEFISEQLLKAFEDHYNSPLDIVARLQETLRVILEEQFYYTGKKIKGCNLGDANRWQSYLEKIFTGSYENYFTFIYPYSNELNEAVLMHFSDCPMEKTREELKELLNTQEGLIYFNNTLFYTHFSAQNAPLLSIFYEFSDDEEDNDLLAIKSQCLQLPQDVFCPKRNILNNTQLELIRTHTGNCGLGGLIVDLDWVKINSRLLGQLVNEQFLIAPLFPSESNLKTLIQESASSLSLEALCQLTNELLLGNVYDFILFIEQFNNLKTDSKITCLQWFIENVPLSEESSLAYLFTKVASYENSDLNQNAFKCYKEKVSTTIKNQLLSEAIESKNQDLCKELLRIGADPNYNKPHSTNNALFLAINNELDAVADQMLEMKLEDSTIELTVLRLGSLLEGFHCNYLKRILQQFPEIDLNNWTLFPSNNSVLHTAILTEKPTEILALLCRMGASIINLNAAGKSPLDLAINTGKPELIQLLIQEYPLFDEESYLITVCTKLSDCNKLDLMKQFLERYEEELATSIKNQLLYDAILNKDQFLCKELLALGANPNYKETNNDINLFRLALINDLDEVIPIILEMPLEEGTLASVVWYLAQNTESVKLDILRLVLQKNPQLNLNQWHHIEKKSFTLHEAVITKKPLEFIALLCRAGAYILQVNAEEDAPLDIAIEALDFDIVKVLFEEHQPNLLKPNLMYLCDSVIEHQRFDLVELLLKRYSETTCLAVKNDLLCEAIEQGNEDLCRQLLIMGANPNYLTSLNKKDPLWLAITHGLSSIVEILLGMKLETITLQSTVLSLCTQSEVSYIEYLRRILKENPDLNLNYMNHYGSGNYTLHEAILHRQPDDILITMCRMGVKLNNYNRQGKSALDLLLENSQFELAGILLENHKILVKEEDLITVCKVIACKQPALIKLALKSYDENMTLSIKNQLMGYGLIAHRPELCQEMISLGINNNYIMPNTNNSLFWLAIIHKHPIAQLMLDNGLEPATLKTGLLYLAAYKESHCDVYFQLILQKYADLNLNDWRYDFNWNYTLHEAVANNKAPEILELLCRRGADFTLLNKANKSALDLALEAEQFDVLKVLLNTHVLLKSNQLTFVFSKLLEHKKNDLIPSLLNRYCENDDSIKDQLLCEAIIQKKSDLCLELLSLGANVNYIRQASNENMLWLALTNNLYELANTMLDHQLDINTLQTTTLFLSSQKEHYAAYFIKSILQKHRNFDVNIMHYQKNQYCALHNAVFYDKPAEILTALCQAGANIILVDSCGNSALDLALDAKRYDIASILIEYHKPTLLVDQLIPICLELISRDKIDFVLLLLKNYSEDCSSIIKSRMLCHAIETKNYTRMSDLICYPESGIFPAFLKYNKVVTRGEAQHPLIQAEDNLSWLDFIYTLDLSKWQNKKLFNYLISYQQSLTPTPQTQQDYVKQQALACFNYITTHPTQLKAIKNRKLFLNRLVCGELHTQEEVKIEARSFMQGSGIYSQNCFGSCSSGTKSRVKNAYQVGLFGQSSIPFNALPRKEKKRILSMATH